MLCARLKIFFAQLVCLSHLMVSTGSPSEAGKRLVGTQYVYDTLEEVLEENRFITERNFLRFVHEFGPLFRRHVGKLDGSSHWINFGSGAGYLERSYYSRPRTDEPMGPHSRFVKRILSRPASKRARITGITYKSEVDPSAEKRFQGDFIELPTHEQAIEILLGLFETMDLSKIMPAALLTDFLGIFPYSTRPDLILAKYFDLLAPRGNIWIYGRDNNPIRGSGEFSNIREWLDAIEGINADWEAKKVLRIQRKRNQRIVIPRLTWDEDSAIYYEAEPPFGEFRVGESSIIIPGR